MNIYCNTNKPTDGWIHGCFNCGANTSYTRNYRYDKQTHVVFLLTDLIMLKLVKEDKNV